MDADRDLRAANQAREAIRVLVVEDDAALREAVVRGLSKAGFVVDAAGSGARAVELARTGAPDVAVIDVMLPDSGGLGVARALRRERGLAALPVLFVTALAPAAIRDSLFPAPVLYKPYTYRQLVAALRDLLRLQEGRRRGPAAAAGG